MKANRLLKNIGNRLLTRAARHRAFAITYEPRTGESGPAEPFFSILLNAAARPAEFEVESYLMLFLNAAGVTMSGNRKSPAKMGAH